MEFPIYRMFVNGKLLYKIVNNRNFEEIQIIGTKLKYLKMEVKQYPEILKIQDMIALHNNLYLEMNEELWDDYFSKLDSLSKDL